MSTHLRPLYRSWGDRLRETRTEKGYTQRQLGVAAGLQQNAVSRYENGTKPTDAARIALARALGVTVAELFPYEPEGLA